ncbi:hypothetical protein PF006_g9343 [Phytophthora fragariae]|uniref:Uncharacterized protein n=1 Tax=Phytophthora fragariae TaxID=53985 RepID=A0A6A3U586_9STRA|nr:hypothetical protein PF006_g9343 [Phytophthora fragariae]
MSDDEDKLLRLLVGKYIKKGKPKGSKVHDTGRMLAQLAFWCDMREALAANEATMGLEILDDVAEAILDESGKAKEALSGPVLILPEPSRQCKSQGAPDHQRFTSYMPESPMSQPSSARNHPSPGKKRKASSAAKAVSFFMDALAEKVPQQIRIDLDKLYERASKLNVSPYELAYPWKGSRLFYDPALYPHVHVGHWGWWHQHRPNFWDWQLHAPLAGRKALDRHRKRKMDAVDARLVFISLCIETWGYYNFLQRLEDILDERLLMWWGGQPGKNQPQGTDYIGPVIESLAVLRRRDAAAYSAKMKHALEPFHLDRGGFTRMTDMLLWTGAMDVDARPEKRLSDRALARILHDINSKRDARAHWVGDRAKGTWLALWNCDRIQKEEANISKELLDDKYKFPEVPPFDPKEAKAPGYTPILTPQGSYTALWKSNSGDDDEDDEEDDGSGSEEDDSEEEKPPPPKKAKPSRSSSDSSGDGNTATL